MSQEDRLRTQGGTSGEVHRALRAMGDEGGDSARILQAAEKLRPERTSGVSPCRSVVSAAHLGPFLRQLRNRAIDPSVSFPEDHWPRPERDVLLPASRFIEFLRLCRNLTDDECVGLHAGEQVRLEDLGLLGLLARSVPLGRDACTALQRYCYLLDPMCDCELHWSQSGVRCTQVYPSGKPVTRAWGEYFAARTVTLGKILAGAEPVSVRFAHPPPRKLHEHARVFGAAALEFGRGVNEVLYSPAVLDHPMLHSDPITVEVVSRHLRVQCPEAGYVDKSLVARVKTVILRRIGDEELSVAVVARKLGQSERTLRRQLHASGTSYQALLNEIRLELVRQYLANGLSKAEISSLVGFGEAGSFYRALKRWKRRREGLFTGSAADE